MSVVGFQDFWVAGARVYIEKATSGTAQLVAPLIDLGVIQSANPTIAPEVVQVQDSDGGTKSIIDEGVIGIDESYDVQMSNFNPDNLSLLWMADESEDIVQSLLGKAAFHTVTSGRFVKIKINGDGSDAEWGLLSIDGLYSQTGTIEGHIPESMTKSTNLITLAIGEGDKTALYTVGRLFIVSGTNLDDPLNAGTYTVVSSAFVASKTEITINATKKAINSDETFSASTGIIINNTTGQTFELDIDWSIHSKERGIVGILAGGSITDEKLGIAWTTNSLQGARLIKPQSSFGVIKARVYITYTRENFARQTVREFDASITPSSSNIQATDFSTMTLTFRVLSDLTKAEPAGRLFSYRGAVPNPSDPGGLD